MDEQSIFLAALEKADDERIAWLAEVCGDDVAMKDRIQALLQQGDNATSFLERPAMEMEIDTGSSVLQAISNCFDEVPRVALRNRETSSSPGADVQEHEDGGSRYQLHGEIARGGMGAIISGRDTDLGRNIAIKVLLDAHSENPDHVRRFVEEAQICGQLQHPGIVPVYELGQFKDQRPFFSMKLVNGQTLASLMEQQAEFGVDRDKLLRVFQQVCETVAYAHSKGVIHRDLKPANVMVGTFGEVQVMDWGLAKVLPEVTDVDEKTIGERSEPEAITTLREGDTDVEGGADSNTRLGSVMGTFAYMPPEQALGEVDKLDERADVFALGAVLCEILTGKPPYCVDEENRDLHAMASGGQLDECFARLDACQADSEIVDLAKSCLSPNLGDRLRNGSR